MNFDKNFALIGEIDTTDLEQGVLSLTEEQWNDFEIRQNVYEVHQHTRTIGLVYDLDFRHSHPTRLPTLGLFEDALKPVLWMVADYYEQTSEGQRLTQENGLGYFIRASLVSLKAGSDIAEHRDMNFSLTHSHRVHLPIVTSDEVWFTVAGESINMKKGQVTEINNRRVHSVTNDGEQNRVHLILDYVLRGEMCCCGAKHHPDTRCSPQSCHDTVTLKIPCTCHPEN